MKSTSRTATSGAQSNTTRRRLGAAVTATSLLAASVVAGVVSTPSAILALPGANESAVVTVEPTRVLDTRFDVGLAGSFESRVSRKLPVTGTVETYVEATDTRSNQMVVPTGATGVLLNVTAVLPTGAGFLSIRPGDATGYPSTAGVNFVPGDVVPNAVTVALPTAGSHSGNIDITYGQSATGHTLDVVIDIVGYTTNAGLQDLTNRVVALETSGVQGEQGDKGDKGDQGAPGAAGPAGPQHGYPITFDTGVVGDGDVGSFGLGLTIGVDGNPVIAHDLRTNNGLRVSHCDAVTCAGTVTTSTTDSGNDFGDDVSIVIGSDGLPIAVHYDSTDSAVVVTKCSTLDCSVSSSLSLPPGAQDPVDPAITIGSDGFPVIAYTDTNAEDLVLVRCTHLMCVTGESGPFPSANNDGADPSLTVGTDGFPMIVHHDETDDLMRVIRCLSAGCGSFTSYAVSNGNDIGNESSIAIGTDGLALIAHWDTTSQNLVVTHCSNASCSIHTTTTVTTINADGLTPSIAIDASGLPIIAHRDYTDYDLVITRCSDITCTSSTNTTIETDNTDGGRPSIAIGSDGNPVVAHYDSFAQEVRLVHLSNSSWTVNTWD